MTAESAIEREAITLKRSIKNIQDYARAVIMQTWQRQSIFAAISILTGVFFVPWKAALFFSICMFCEYADLGLAKKARRLSVSDIKGIRMTLGGFICNTILSSMTISVYAVWVGITEGGVGTFTALFCLFSAALYAAMNNHQIATVLTIRLTVYGLSFLAITVRDLVVFSPPLDSDIWLQFFTVIFVMYFLIDCSLGFLRLYRQDLKRLEDLEAEHNRAKAALVLKSQFVAVVSHELRTPLTSIKGALDLVNSGQFGEFPPQAQSLLDIASRNSRRLATLVDDLLDLQKLEAGEMRFKKETVDIRGFISDAISSHRGLAEKYGVRLKLLTSDAKSVFVRSDPSRLMQVLGNIISNAAKFSPENGEVEIWSAVSKGRVRIYIRDHGIGIPKGAREEVFGRFTQIDSTDQRKFGGTGLGMNISREIIEALGGTIDYESELGVGTTFFMELPCTTVLDAGSGTTDDAPPSHETDEAIQLPRLPVRARS